MRLQEGLLLILQVLVCRLLLHLELVESLSEHAHHLALGYERIRIDVVNHTIDVGCLTLTGHDDDQLDVVPGIISLRINNRTGSVGLVL